MAVLLVLMFHVGGGGHSPYLIVRCVAAVSAIGWIGVTLFFILSGFLITGILWDSRGEEHWRREFYARRTFRIFPLYYGSLIAVLVAACVVGTFDQAWPRICFPMLFLQDFPGTAGASILNTGSPLRLFHFWSLAIEEQFYLIWPTLVLIPKTKRGMMRLCVALFVLSELYLQAQTSLPIGRWSPMLFGRSAELIAGAWLAMAYRTPIWPKLRNPALICAPLGLVGYLIVTRSRWDLPLLTLAFASLLILCLQVRLLAAATSARWLRWLGSISYGIYVYHVLLSRGFEIVAHAIAGEAKSTEYEAVLVAVTVMATLLIAWCSWTFIERPIIEAYRRVAKRKALRLELR